MVFITPDSLQDTLAQTVKARRIVLQMTQREVAERAQVSLSVVRKFEQTSQISWASLARLLY
ncbi:MAG TPA: XRE family transcriptional regulator, partial [Cytophagales bacterium]|nr:XRE family transcriptional regulator [Cytophagales bacterium]